MPTNPSPNPNPTIPHADTIAGYDRWSSSYDTEDNPAIALTGWMLDRVPLGAGGRDVLELGCGTGRNARRVLDEGARSYLGVDGSAGMLAVAAQRVTDPRAAWAPADLLAPWLPPRRFELALVALVLEHLPSLAPLAETLAGVVQPGGRVRIVDLHAERIAAGFIAQFVEDGAKSYFTSTAHAVDALRAALEPAFELTIDEVIATDDLIARIPKLARQRGGKVGIDLRGTRRG